MREIIFKGKRKDNGEWVEGSAINTQYDVRGEKHIYIGVLTKYEIFSLMQTITWYEVIPESISEFTGLTDKNGKKIFEGDIVRSCVGTYVVKFLTGSWCCSLIEREYLTLLSTISAEEVIGNIHDNPELLKGGAE